MWLEEAECKATYQNLGYFTMIELGKDTEGNVSFIPLQRCLSYSSLNKKVSNGAKTALLCGPQPFSLFDRGLLIFIKIHRYCHTINKLCRYAHITVQLTRKCCTTETGKVETKLLYLNTYIHIQFANVPKQEDYWHAAHNQILTEAKPSWHTVSLSTLHGIIMTTVQNSSKILWAIKI